MSIRSSTIQRPSRPKDKYRINERIRCPTVLVIKDGQKIGILETRSAIVLAREAGLDLVEISPDARPPVCKIVDYGKMKYEEKKKEKEQKAKQTVVLTKEMKFRPKTEEHDLEFKTRHIQRFLEEGNRCLMVVQLKGRERAHPRVGEELLKRVAASLGELAEIGRGPILEGNNVTMLLTPKSGTAKKDE